MDANVSSDRIAVLIDGENTRAAYADEVLSEVAKYGNPTIKRVYGDWTNSHLSPWARRLNSLGLRAMHQNAFTKSKNSSDLALVIDAMDLLYDDNVEAFALVTSDSDFTSLAHRLRESGKTVYVLGENKAPDALKNACDKFIDLEVVQDGKKSDADEVAADDQDDSATRPRRRSTSRAHSPAPSTRSRTTTAGRPWRQLGNQLNRTYPSFDARSFGDSGTRLSTLVAGLTYLETSGSGNAMRVRDKGAARRRPRRRPEEPPRPAQGGAGAEASAKQPQQASRATTGRTRSTQVSAGDGPGPQGIEGPGPRRWPPRPRRPRPPRRPSPEGRRPEGHHHDARREEGVEQEGCGHEALTHHSSVTGGTGSVRPRVGPDMSTRTRAAGVLTALTMTVVLAACSSNGGSDAGASDVASMGESSAGGGSDGSAGREPRARRRRGLGHLRLVRVRARLGPRLEGGHHSAAWSAR